MKDYPTFLNQVAQVKDFFEWEGFKLLPFGAGAQFWMKKEGSEARLVVLFDNEGRLIDFCAVNKKLGKPTWEL